MTIGATANGLTLVASESLILCWDGDLQRRAGSGNPVQELKNMSLQELRQLMNSAEQWQANNEALRQDWAYHSVSSYMQQVKAEIKSQQK